MIKLNCVVFMLMVMLGASVRAADLPLGHPDFVPTPASPIGWRGDGSGRFPGATPVTDWDLKTKKNVVWQVRMPFFSCAGPIVVGDKVFTTGEPDLLICVEAKTGKELWRRHNAIFMEQIEEKERERLYKVCEDLLDIAEKWMRTPGESDGKPDGDLPDAPALLWAQTGDSRKTHLEPSVKITATKLGLDLDKIRAMYAEVGSNGNQKNTATKLPKGKGLLNNRCYSWTGNMPATPASDGKHVVIKVASENGWGYMVCYDLDGNRQWSYETGLTGVWGCPYDSPLILGDKVFVQSQSEVSDKKRARGIAALDINTGKRLWFQVVQTQSSSGTPNAWVIDGVPTIHFDTKVYLPEDGTVVCDFSALAQGDMDTPCIDGNRIFFRRAAGPAVDCKSTVIKATWKTKGKELLCEQEWKTTYGNYRLRSNWVRGSSLLLGDWIFISSGHPTPILSAYNWTLPPEQPDGKNEVRPDKSLLVRLDRGGPKFGPPSEDDMSVVMGGQYLFAAPSTWPSQFVVVQYPPAAKKIADLKFVSAPVVDGAMMGSPYFQGNRIYMRDYRYLYGFGDPDQPYRTPSGGK